MTVGEMLKRYGLKPEPKDLPAIRKELSWEIDRDPCNEPLMCLCCVQLFACGLPEDAVLIWRAKLRTFDMAVRIDVQLLCGAGLDETKNYHAGSTLPEAAGILDYIHDCEATGDFDDWSPEQHLDRYRAEYGHA